MSPVLGIVSIKQDVRQALLNPRGTDTTWQSLWGGAGPHPGKGETKTDQSSLAHLKLPAGTKACHINWMPPDAQSLCNSQKIAFYICRSKSWVPCEVTGEMMGSNRQWWFLLWCVLPTLVGKLRLHPELPTGAWWSSEGWHFLCSSRLSCHRLSWTEYVSVKEEVGLISVGCLSPQAAAGTFTQLLAYNKSSYKFVLFIKYVGEKMCNSSSWTHNIVVFHCWQLVVSLNFVKDVGYFIKVNKAIWNECSKRKTLLFLLKPSTSVRTQNCVFFMGTLASAWPQLAVFLNNIHSAELGFYELQLKLLNVEYLIFQELHNFQINRCFEYIHYWGKSSQHTPLPLKKGVFFDCESQSVYSVLSLEKVKKALFPSIRFGVGTEVGSWA